MKKDNKTSTYITLVVLMLLMVLIPVIVLAINGENDTSSEVVYTDVAFEEIYAAYKNNELSADDKYKGNRYSLTVQVRDIQSTDDSLLYWDNEIVIEFEIMVGNTHVVGEALFEKEQRDALKDINVGDTITFIGVCRSAGAWINCELV